MSMRRFGVVALLGASLLEFASAQGTTTTLGVSTTYVPTAAWSPAPVCSAGSSSGTAQGGVYQDESGNFYEMQCGPNYSGTNYYDLTAGNPVFVGTTGQGIGSCFWGCSQRPSCMGFTYTGVVGSNVYPWTGSSGRCYHYLNNTQGTLQGNAASLGGQTVYGSAYLLQAYPGTLCPAYDGQTFADSWGGSYAVSCAAQPATTTAGGSVPKSTTVVQNIQSCLSACDAAGTAVCNHVAYSYAAIAEPSPYRASHTFGSCTMFTGTATATNAGAARYMYAVQAASVSDLRLAWEIYS